MNNPAPSILSDARVLELAPSDVLIPERIGFLHEDKAAALGRLMAVDGQRDPIKVTRNLPDKPIEAVVAEGKAPWRLVTGMHRLMGATYENITVFAHEVDGDAEELAELEASENLHRRPLGPVERAKFTAALVQAAQERIAREHGNISHQRLGAKIRWERVRNGEDTPEKALNDEANDACAKIAQAYGWEDSVDDALGLSRRTIHNDLSLFRLLIEPFPDLAEPLSKHPVVGENASQLRMLAQIRDEARRREAVTLLLEEKHLSADQARVRVGVDTPKSEPPTRDVKFASTISDSWSRLSTRAKRDYLPRFVGLLTDDQKARLRGLLDGEAE